MGILFLFCAAIIGANCMILLPLTELRDILNKISGSDLLHLHKGELDWLTVICVAAAYPAMP